MEIIEDVKDTAEKAGKKIGNILKKPATWIVAGGALLVYWLMQNRSSSSDDGSIGYYATEYDGYPTYSGDGSTSSTGVGMDTVESMLISQQAQMQEYMTDALSQMMENQAANDQAQNDYFNSLFQQNNELLNAQYNAMNENVGRLGDMLYNLQSNYGKADYPIYSQGSGGGAWSPLDGSASNSGMTYNQIIAEIQKNSVAWHSADDATKKQLESANQALGNMIGADFDSGAGTWSKDGVVINNPQEYNPYSVSVSKTPAGNSAGVKAGVSSGSTNKNSAASTEQIKSQMAANSVAWHTADAATKKQLEAANQKLGAQIGGKFDSASGSWTFN